MRLLGIIFAGMFMYGLLTAHLGGAMIALGMVFFVAYGSRELAKRDAEFYATPAGARQIANTQQMLTLQQCECTASRF